MVVPVVERGLLEPPRLRAARGPEAFPLHAPHRLVGRDGHKSALFPRRLDGRHAAPHGLLPVVEEAADEEIAPRSPEGYLDKIRIFAR